MLIYVNFDRRDSWKFAKKTHYASFDNFTIVQLMFDSEEANSNWSIINWQYAKTLVVLRSVISNRSKFMNVNWQISTKV